jgi:Protein of unknown function DUF262
MENNNKIFGDRYSLLQLFIENKFTIEIPMIQRDYAQGRESKSEVRELFLDALYNYLQENIPFRDLDFIYGNIESADGIDRFIPLDGQQRLTTLFLLHWYLSRLSDSSSAHFDSAFVKNNKALFQYNIRPSSTEFINSLVNNKVDLSLIGGRDKLSGLITDKGWFFRSWKLDPTIQSMLVMLDAIHNKFNNKLDFYERLTNLEKPIITFQFLNLKESSLSEDIYIKMNSRGKPLTSFENFKAKLEQHIKAEFGEVDKPFQIKKGEATFNYTWKDYFSNQIETTWANLFWNYRKLVGKPDIYDEELMNFIRVVLASQYAIDSPEEITNFAFLIKNESATAEITKNISFYSLKEKGCLTKSTIEFLIKSLDALSNGHNKIRNILPANKYYNESEMFEKALKYPISMPERVIFFAYLKFIITYDIDKLQLFQWMRVVHNLVENSRIETSEDCATAIRSINNLLKHATSIIDFLQDPKSKIEYFVSWQTEEEKIKACLIIRDNNWKQLIENGEGNIFHKGQIGYILEFSGIVDYYRKQNNCSWDANEDAIFKKRVSDYLRKSTLFFEFQDSENNVDYLAERALLCKGDYLVPAEYNRYNFSTAKQVNNYQRYYSWKRILRLSVEDVEMWKEKREHFKNLFNDETVTWESLESSLNKVIKVVPTDWRSFFVLNPQLIRYPKQGFIERNGDVVELYNASQINHLHINMRVYNLYTNYLENQDDEIFFPFKYRAFEEVKGTWDDSFLYLSDWCFQRINYTLQIFFVDEKFLIKFKKQKGKNTEEDYNATISEILEQNKFKWDDKSEDSNNHAFVKKLSNEATVFTLIKSICKEFCAL